MEQEDIAKRIKEWMENPQLFFIHLSIEQKSLEKRIDDWMKKADK